MKITKMLNTAFRQDCLWCGRDHITIKNKLNSDQATIDLCKECQQCLSRNLVCCERCAIPLITTDSQLEKHSVLCGQCQSKPPSWQRAVVSFNYAYPMDCFLMALKYNGRIDIAKCMARLMSEDLKHCYDFSERSNHIPQYLIPVPLHPLRETRRGYNQATLLAKELGKVLQIPVDSNYIERVRHTPRQSSLSKAQRSKNLLKAFKVQTESNAPNFVAIIDDVMTTGSTAELVSKTLKKAGVKRVDVWCCARAD